MGMTRVRLLAVTVGLMAVATMVGGSLAATAPCRPGPAAACAGADLDGAKLTKKNLTGATLTRASLVGARLQGARLRGAKLARANLTRANLTGADLRGADLSRARLRGAILRKARMGRLGTSTGSGARITAAPCGRNLLCTGRMAGVDLRGADLTGAIIVSADLSGADLRKARAFQVILTAVDLSGAKLDGVDLTGSYLAEINLQGASLAGADLSKVRLESGVNLQGVSLVGVKLDGAVISEGVNLNGADLRGVDLSSATIDPRALSGAKLDGATLPPAIAARTTITSTRAFTAKVIKGDLNTTCTDVTECTAFGAPAAASTLAVTTTWAGFAFCPDGPVRLTTADGGATYTGTCSYSAVAGVTIRIRETRRITVSVKDLIGDPATIDRIAFQWREPTSYDLVEAEHACTGVSACIGDYADGSRVKVVITGSGPYHTPIANSCQGGTPVGESTMVSGPPWQLTCLVGDDGNPLQLSTDRELVLTLS